MVKNPWISQIMPPRVLSKRAQTLNFSSPLAGEGAPADTVRSCFGKKSGGCNIYRTGSRPKGRIGISPLCLKEIYFLETETSYKGRMMGCHARRRSICSAFPCFQNRTMNDRLPFPPLAGERRMGSANSTDFLTITFFIAATARPMQPQFIRNFSIIARSITALKARTGDAAGRAGGPRGRLRGRLSRELRAA
jgi:hypothetical protein